MRRRFQAQLDTNVIGHPHHHVCPTCDGRWQCMNLCSSTLNAAGRWEGDPIECKKCQAASPTTLQPAPTFPCPNCGQDTNVVWRFGAKPHCPRCRTF